MLFVNLKPKRFNCKLMVVFLKHQDIKKEELQIINTILIDKKRFLTINC